MYTIAHISFDRGDRTGTCIPLWKHKVSKEKNLLYRSIELRAVPIFPLEFVKLWKRHRERWRAENWASKYTPRLQRADIRDVFSAAEEK